MLHGISRWAATGATIALGALALNGCGSEAQSQALGSTSTATVPVTPSLPTDRGVVDEQGVRTFEVTASEFTQKISNFPLQTATVWGYNGSTPGPTLIANEGEAIRIILNNNLPPGENSDTTIHLHGLHQPNEFDGVAGISQPDPIPPGGSFTYGPFVPRHSGTFSYHSHTHTAVQDLRGLSGMIVILPQNELSSEHVDKDYVMTLQQFAPPSEGALVNPFPGGTGGFPFSTINGKTGDASGETINIDEGDRVRIRFYNASNVSHTMHLHGHDEVLVSKNGHPVPITTETSQQVGPGDFFEIDWTADNPGNWIFHCHIPHHTSNMQQSGYNGSPVGMTRIFHYNGFQDVRDEYFSYDGG